MTLVSGSAYVFKIDLRLANGRMRHPRNVRTQFQNPYGSFQTIAGPILGSLYERDPIYYFGSILGAPNSWKLPYGLDLEPERMQLPLGGSCGLLFRGSEQVLWFISRVQEPPYYCHLLRNSFCFYYNITRRNQSTSRRRRRKNRKT